MPWADIGAGLIGVGLILACLSTPVDGVGGIACIALAGAAGSSLAYSADCGDTAGGCTLGGSALATGVGAATGVALGVAGKLLEGLIGLFLEDSGVVGVKATTGLAGAEALSGSGPVPGVLEASERVKSLAALRNYCPKGGVEYVFDPATGRFATGRPAVSAGLKGSPHEQLAESIGADPSRVVGGTLTRGVSGVFETIEQSGHFWRNWTPEIRKQFVSTMRGYGLDVSH